MRAELDRQLREYCRAIDEGQGVLAVEDVLERSGDIQVVPRRRTLGPLRPRRWAVAAIAVLALVVVAIGIRLLPSGDLDPVDTPPTVAQPTTALGNGVIVNGWRVVVTPPGVDRSDLRFPTLSPGPGVNAPMAWAPDGRRLAVIDAVGRLVVVDTLDGTVDARVDEIFDCECTLDWSPDGSTIVVAGFATDGQLYAVDTATWQGSPLVDTGPSLSMTWDASWSPDGEWIAFGYISDEGPGIGRVRRDGSDFTTVADGLLGSVDWSPADNRIAVLAAESIADGRRGSTGAETLLALWMVDGDGAGAEKVAELGRCACLGASPGLGWSPDGATLALNIPDPNSDVITASTESWGLYLMNPDGTDLRRISEFRNGDPAWQPIPMTGSDPGTPRGLGWVKVTVGDTVYDLPFDPATDDAVCLIEDGMLGGRVAVDPSGSPVDWYSDAQVRVVFGIPPTDWESRGLSAPFIRLTDGGSGEVWLMGNPESDPEIDPSMSSIDSWTLDGTTASGTGVFMDVDLYFGGYDGRERPGVVTMGNGRLLLRRAGSFEINCP